MFFSNAYLLIPRSPAPRGRAPILRLRCLILDEDGIFSVFVARAAVAVRPAVIHLPRDRCGIRAPASRCRRRNVAIRAGYAQTARNAADLAFSRNVAEVVAVFDDACIRLPCFEMSRDSDNTADHCSVCRSDGAVILAAADGENTDFFRMRSDDSARKCKSAGNSAGDVCPVDTVRNRELRIRPPYDSCNDIRRAGDRTARFAIFNGDRRRLSDTDQRRGVWGSGRDITSTITFFTVAPPT